MKAKKQFSSIFDNTKYLTFDLNTYHPGNSIKYMNIGGFEVVDHVSKIESTMNLYIEDLYCQLYGWHPVVDKLYYGSLSGCRTYIKKILVKGHS